MQQRVRIAQRRQEVARCLKSGMSRGAIADRLSVSRDTVTNDIRIVFQEWRVQTTLDANSAMLLDLQRLDEWLEALSPKARTGDLDAIATGLKILGRRARMLGYDAPERHELHIKQPIADRVFGLLTPSEFDQINAASVTEAPRVLQAIAEHRPELQAVLAGTDD
jgi:DNA-binding CsgD family transcriptional regulator